MLVRFTSLVLMSMGSLRANIGGPEVPEPGTWMLMGAGLGAFWWGLRRRRRQGRD